VRGRKEEGKPKKRGEEGPRFGGGQRRSGNKAVSRKTSQAFLANSARLFPKDFRRERLLGIAITTQRGKKKSQQEEALVGTSGNDAPKARLYRGGKRSGVFVNVSLENRTGMGA